MNICDVCNMQENVCEEQEMVVDSKLNNACYGLIKSIFCVLRGGLKIWCDEEGVFLCWVGEGEALFFVWRRELGRVIGRRDKCV